MSEAAQSLPTRPSTDGTIGMPTVPKLGFGDFKGAFNEDVYPAHCVDVEVREMPTFKDPSKSENRIVWLFTLDGREKDGKVAVVTSFSLHEKSQLPKVTAALGTPAAANKALVKADYVGKPARLLLEKVEGKDYPKVAKVMGANI